MSEPFYMPPPALFGHADAYRLFTNYAAKLEAAGLAGRFPEDAELRHAMIEMLAERYAAEDVAADPDEYLEDALAEALIERDRRSPS